MIITKTPFRISFCGGGSDIPSFYEKHGGCVVSTTIDKYMFLSIHPSFETKTTTIKYTKTEEVLDVSALNHELFRQCLMDLKISGVEISSVADIPAGTGLGSSSTFTVGLLQLLYCYKSKYVSKERLADEACQIEIEKLGAPIGKQDQYAASYGGLKMYRFHPDGSVEVEPIIMKKHLMRELEENLLMFYTGDVRSTATILAEQSVNITSGEKELAQLKMSHMAETLKNHLQNGTIDAMGKILHESWLLKRTLASGITNPNIDEWYDLAIKNGAMGGKLLGAGGGGFMLFYVKKDKQDSVRNALSHLSELEFSFDKIGTNIVYIGEKPSYI